MRESKIQRHLIVGVTLLDGLCEKKIAVGRRGHPDLEVAWAEGPYIASKDAWVEFIETKAPGGKPTPVQLRDHERRRAMGFTVHVISTMEQAEAYLRSRGKK